MVWPAVEEVVEEVVKEEVEGVVDEMVEEMVEVVEAEEEEGTDEVVKAVEVVEAVNLLVWAMVQRQRPAVMTMEVEGRSMIGEGELVEEGY